MMGKKYPVVFPYKCIYKIGHNDASLFRSTKLEWYLPHLAVHRGLL